MANERVFNNDALTSKEFHKKKLYGSIEHIYLDESEYERYMGIVIIPNDEKALQTREQIDDYMKTL